MHETLRIVQHRVFIHKEWGDQACARMGDSGLATIDVQRTHVTSLVHNERHRWPARGHAPLHYVPNMLS